MKPFFSGWTICSKSVDCIDKPQEHHQEIVIARHNSSIFAPLSCSQNTLAPCAAFVFSSFASSNHRSSSSNNNNNNTSNQIDGQPNNTIKNTQSAHDPNKEAEQQPQQQRIRTKYKPEYYRFSWRKLRTVVIPPVPINSEYADKRHVRVSGVSVPFTRQMHRRKRRQLERRRLSQVTEGIVLFR